jgi:hypothetical protein
MSLCLSHHRVKAGIYTKINSMKGISFQKNWLVLAHKYSRHKLWYSKAKGVFGSPLVS